MHGPGPVLAMVALVLRNLRDHITNDSFMLWLANVTTTVAGILSVAFIIWQWRKMAKKK